MKKYVLVLSSLVLCITGLYAQHTPVKHDKSTASDNNGYVMRWTVDPFDGKIFIQNLGQFDSIPPGNEKVLYSVGCANGIKMFFTKNRIIYSYEKMPDAEKSIVKGHEEEENDPDKGGAPKPITYYIQAEWVAANPYLTVVADSEQSYPYIYTLSDGKTNVNAAVYKKLTYKNIYPGIDIEYFFPKKGGIKYNVLVHPGADISVLKLKYSGIKGLTLDKNGNVVVNTDFGKFIDHAPISYYDVTHKSVGTYYNVNGLEETFGTKEKINAGEQLDIDPWQTDPFPGTSSLDKVYDVDFDNAGNVYGYGSGNPYKLIKLSNIGAILWTYNCTTLVTCYGDFAVDKKTGTSYVTEGYDGSGAKALKINTLGVLKATFAGTTNMDELWRDEYDECSGQVICGAGGTTGTNQGCVMDTTLATMTPVNVMGVAQNYHDVCLLAIDPSGKSCYMCSTSDAIDTGNANNFLFNLPIPALLPKIYSARDGFHFLEDGTCGYYGSGTSGGYYGNGYNGIAVSQNWLYLYDGATLERLNKANGAILQKAKISNRVSNGTVYYNLFSGGLDVDVCNNVYVGRDSAVMVYNANLAKTSTIAVATTNTYDIRLDTAHKSMYVGAYKLVASIALPANPPPTITKTRTPAACSACNGTATAELTYCGSPDTIGVTYAWAPGGQTTRTVTGLCPGTYTITISVPVGCNVQKYTDTVNIYTGTGSSGGLVVTKTISEVACNGGSTGSINLTVTGGSGTYAYTWTPAVGTNGSATALPIGTYTCDVKDVSGCDTAAEVITITQPAVLKLSAAAFPVACGSGCNGQATAIPSGGTSPYTYLWSNAATTANITNLCAGTYSIVVKDKNGCVVDSVNLTVTVSSSLVLTQTAVTAHCNQADGSATISVTGGTAPYTYLWSNGNITTGINNVKPGIYCVKVTDFAGCKDSVCITVANQKGDTAQITSVTNVTCNGGNNGSIIGGVTGGTGPYTYDWSNAQTTPTATGLAAGNYTLTVTDATGCPDTAVATITQPAAVVATPGAPKTICIGQTDSVSVTCAGGTAPYTYAWSTGCTSSSCAVTPTATTTYTVTPTDANGCTGTPVNVTVTVNPPLKVVTSPQRSACPGSSVTISDIASGGDGTYSYAWTPATGLTCSSCQSTTAAPVTSTEYVVTLSDACGTTPVTDSVIVIIDPLPTVNFIPDTAVGGCSPYCVAFTDNSTVNPGGIKSWSWTFGDGGTSTIKDPNHCYNLGGVYSVGLTVTSDSGCTATLNINDMVTVYPHPVAAFTYTPQPATIVDPTVHFIDETKDSSGIKTWFWQFNDGSDSTSFLENPTHTYADTGVYCAELIVVDNQGCIDSVNECVDIEPFYTLYIPNAFSPNGDGLNDVFLPKGDFVCSFQMYIFDRWGQQLFFSDDMNKGWNGCVGSGQTVVQEDTYVYLIYATDCEGHKKHEYLGAVSVIK